MALEQATKALFFKPVCRFIKWVRTLSLAAPAEIQVSDLSASPTLMRSAAGGNHMVFVPGHN
jgi:hypothetical protein